MLELGKIFQFTSVRFQQDNLSIGECKDELMVAFGQLTLLRDSEGKTWEETVSNANADKDKVDVLRGLIHEFEGRHESLKSCDKLFIFDPSTWPQGMQDLHNTTLSKVLQKYEAIHCKIMDAFKAGRKTFGGLFYV